MARTLRHLGQHGHDDFYTGELAARIAYDLDKNGSFVTAGDLRRYRLPDAPPNEGSYHDYTISSAAPPHGGATLIAIPQHPGRVRFAEDGPQLA